MEHPTSHHKTGFYPDFDVDMARLKKSVWFLTKIRPFRHYANRQSLDKVAAYIQHQLTQSGLTTHTQPFDIDGESYRNVIGWCGDEHHPRVIVGAHYDVCGEQPGADDNASAVAGLLEIARLVNAYSPRLQYCVEFVTYSLEEPPFFATEDMGSYVHAHSLHQQDIAVQGMICLEMIGYFRTEEHSQEYPQFVPPSLFPSIGNFIAVVGNRNSGELVDECVTHFNHTSVAVECLKVPFAAVGTGVDFSDHRNYWKFDYPAVMITDTAFYRNKNYHTIHETMETLDFGKMAEVVKGVAWTLINLK